MPKARESRPASDGTALPTKINTEQDVTDSLQGWDDITHHIDGTFVLLVRLTRGRYRRRCFLTIAAAERAAARARSRGESATIVLAELRSLYRIGDSS